jgi:hypothetical protein
MVNPQSFSLFPGKASAVPLNKELQEVIDGGAVNVSQLFDQFVAFISSTSSIATGLILILYFIFRPPMLS